MFSVGCFLIRVLVGGHVDGSNKNVAKKVRVRKMDTVSCDSAMFYAGNWGYRTARYFAAALSTIMSRLLVFSSIIYNYSSTYCMTRGRGVKLLRNFDKSDRKNWVSFTSLFSQQKHSLTTVSVVCPNAAKRTRGYGIHCARDCPATTERD